MEPALIPFSTAKWDPGKNLQIQKSWTARAGLAPRLLHEAEAEIIQLANFDFLHSVMNLNERAPAPIQYSVNFLAAECQKMTWNEVNVPQTLHAGQLAHF